MSEDGNNIEYTLQRSYGTNWTKSNMNTIIQWICISSYKISILDEAITYYRNIMRSNVIIGLILSTASGTISAVRFGSGINQTVGFTLNTIFTAMTFSIAIFTGAIKIYQVQERLEEYIKMKQEWITFSARIASELQLPIKLRHDALYIIIKNKAKYLDLLKIETEIPEFIKNKVQTKMKDYNMKDGISLSQIILGIVKDEEHRINNEENKLNLNITKELNLSSTNEEIINHISVPDKIDDDLLEKIITQDKKLLGDNNC